jgi:hypothetical protein
LVFQVIDSSDGFEVVDQADDCVVEFFLVPLLLLQQPVEFLGEIEYHGSGGLVDVLVDGPGQGGEIECEFGGDGHELFFNDLQQLNTLVFAVGNCLVDPFIEGGVEFVLLHCLL